MQIRLGCQLVLSCHIATPVQVLIHPHVSRRADLAAPEVLRITPDRLTEVLMDQGGNRWCRFVAPAGETRLEYETIVSDRGSPDVVVPTARQCPIEALPIDTYRYLNPSRYCDTDRLAELAWSTFAHTPIGWARVQSICDWVHERISFDYLAASDSLTAVDALAQGRGVCRDFAHLAISLCRCLNIPARYCTGYLGYTGVTPRSDPIDFSAWFEAFLEDRWYVFDARYNVPRVGRVLIAIGRDAADVPFLRSFGNHQLSDFTVITQAIPDSEPELLPAGPASQVEVSVLPAPESARDSSPAG